MAKADIKPPQHASPIPAAQERRLTVTALPDHPPTRRVPTLRLKGKWLAQAGFTPSLPVRLRVMGGCIVITLD
jgi:toxic protein SymE